MPVVDTSPPHSPGSRASSRPAPCGYSRPSCVGSLPARFAVPLGCWSAPPRPSTETAASPPVAAATAPPAPYCPRRATGDAHPAPIQPRLQLRRCGLVVHHRATAALPFQGQGIRNSCISAVLNCPNTSLPPDRLCSLSCGSLRRATQRAGRSLRLDLHAAGFC